MKTLNRLWYGAACCAVMAALLSNSQISRGEDAPATKPATAATAAVTADAPPPVDWVEAPPSQAAPVAPATPEAQYAVPGQLQDPAFSRYVDLQLLGQAYSESNPELLIDVAMQLQEGERILQRSHNGLKSSDLLDVALRLSTGKNDQGSLNRLARIAEKTGDKTLADQVKVSRQLGGQARAAVPPLPEPSEQLSLEDIAQLEDMVQQLERAQAVGDGQALRLLQTRLKDSPLEKGVFRTYLETQLAESLSAITESKADEDPVISLLGNLSGTSRALSATTLSCAVLSDPSIPTRTRKGTFRGADAYRIDTATNTITLVEIGGRLVPKHSLEGLRARYGSVYVNSGSYMEIQVDAAGKPLIVNGQTVRTMPGKNITINASNPEVVTVSMRNPTIGGWWKQPDISFADALRLNLEASDGTVGPAAWGATPIVSVNGEIQLPERTVVLTAGSYKWSELNTSAGSVSFNLLLGVGGGRMLIPAPTMPGGIDPQLYARAKAMPGGATIGNIVAAGGGNLTIAAIVAGGGGNLIGDGGGTLSLIGDGGGTFSPLAGTLKVPAIGTLQQRWSEGNEKAIVLDQGGFLIGKGGAGLIGQDGASFSQLIGTGVGSLNGSSAGNIVIPPRTLFSGTSNPYFRNATRLD